MHKAEIKGGGNKRLLVLKVYSLTNYLRIIHRILQTGAEANVVSARVIAGEVMS